MTETYYTFDLNSMDDEEDEDEFGQWVMKIEKGKFIYSIDADNEIIIISDTIHINSLQRREDYSGNEMLEIIMNKVKELQVVYKINKVTVTNAPTIQPNLNYPKISLRVLQFLTCDHDFYSKVGFGPVINGVNHRDDYHTAMKKLQEVSVNNVIQELKALTATIRYLPILHLFYIQYCYGLMLRENVKVDEDEVMHYIINGLCTNIDKECFTMLLIDKINEICEYIASSGCETLGDCFRKLAKINIHKFNELIVHNDRNEIVTVFFPSFCHLSFSFDGVKLFSWSDLITWCCHVDFGL